jgi:transcriptional regulator with XRE-family HTH domain
MVQIPRLREWRELQGWTQKDLAQESGVSARSIAGYEAGASARPGTARKLAEALNIEVADLVITSGKAEAPPSSQLTLNGLLAEERRVKGYRPWTNLFNQKADRWKAQIEHYHLMPPIAVSGHQTKRPFDSGAAAEISAGVLDLTIALREVLGDFKDVVDQFAGTQLEVEVRMEVADLLEAYARLEETAAAITELSRPTPEASLAEMQERRRDEQKAREARQHIRLVRDEIA